MEILVPQYQGAPQYTAQYGLPGGSRFLEEVVVWAYIKYICAEIIY